MMPKVYKTNLKEYFGDLPNGAWIGIIASLLNSIISCAFFFLSIYFVTVLHFSMTISGAILAFYSIGTMAGGLIGGKLGDWFSPRASSIIGLALESLGYFLLVFLKSPELLTINAFILGASSYVFITSNSTLILNYCESNEKQKFKALGILAMMANFGLSVSALLIGYIAHYNFTYIFLAASLILLLLALLASTLTASPKSISISINHSLNKSRFKYNKYFMRIVLICVFLGGSIVAQYASTQPIYIRETFPNWGVKGVSYLFALNCILVVVLQTPIVNLIQNQNKLLMIGLGAFLQGISLFMLNFYTNYFYAMLAILISTIGEVMFFPSIQFICHTIMPESKKNWGMGLYRTTYGGSRAFGSGVGSFIYTNFGAYFLWSLSGLFGIICLILCYSYKKYALPQSNTVHQTVEDL